MPLCLRYFFKQRSWLHNSKIQIPSRAFRPGINEVRRLGTQSHPHAHGHPFGDYDIILPSEPFVFGVEHIPVKSVPHYIRRPPYVFKDVDEDDPYHGDPYTGDGRLILNSEDEQKIRRAAKLARSTLLIAKTWLKPGITTEEIDSRIHDFIISNGAYPSPLGYAGFPKSCCTSVNNVIVHGIPDNRPLLDGDIVNIDVTVFKEGFHGDTSDTFPVGNVDESGLELIKVTQEALAQGIMACGPGKKFSDIGLKIHDFVSRYGFSINQQFTGHGIGKVFHRPPWILHFKNDEPGVMYPGHVFTIEPAIVQGLDSKGWLFPDGWTVSTESGARSAQAEHTVLITESGVEVLTGDIYT